ncbi:MAG: hypothetical protein ACQETK_06895 [Pseudomonadota bacterium]
MHIADPDRSLIPARCARSAARGNILLIALLILVLAGAIAVGAVSLVGSGTSASADRVQSEQALFAAESGIRRIGLGPIECVTGQTYAVGSNAWFDCDPPADAPCTNEAHSLVRGWVGAASQAGALAVQHICINLDLVGGAGPPPECDEADSSWTCAFDDGDVGPGGGPGSDFDNLYAAQDVTIRGGGNRTVEGDACFADGAEVRGRLNFQGNVYWETAENTSGGSSNYLGCVYVAGEVDVSLTDDPDACDEIGSWCPHGGGGDSGWGYSE